ncbi:MAG: hypothetical protein CL675_12815 [Bdellovibrionaceae bacterium]|nr:hypothetical protein [Pseudobdellovibrionaceae bacterium]
MKHEIFRPRHHIPKFSAILWQAVKTPVLIYFAVAGNAVTFASAYLFLILERATNPNVSNYIDALWWAMCTISTVGYGDIAPITTGGRLVGIFLIITGVTFFLSFLALLVSVMSALLNEELQSDS